MEVELREVVCPSDDEPLPTHCDGCGHHCVQGGCWHEISYVCDILDGVLAKQLRFRLCQECREKMGIAFSFSGDIRRRMLYELIDARKALRKVIDIARSQGAPDEEDVARLNEFEKLLKGRVNCG